MNSGKIGADRWTGGEIEGSTRGPRGPKKRKTLFNNFDISEAKAAADKAKACKFYPIGGNHGIADVRKGFEKCESL